jgi:hypothetical protein
MQRAPDFVIDSGVGQKYVAPHVMPLAATMQAPDCLLVQFERPGQGQEDDVVASVLEVKTVARRLGVDGKQPDLTSVPALDGVVIIECDKPFKPSLKFGKLFLVLVNK